MLERPFIAPVDATSSLQLVPAPNGGWVVHECSTDMRVASKIVGAFSSGADMLEALRGLAVPRT